MAEGVTKEGGKTSTETSNNKRVCVRVRSESAAASLLRTSHATCPRFPVPALPAVPSPFMKFAPFSRTAAPTVGPAAAGEVLFHSTCTLQSACQCTAGRRASNNPSIFPLFYLHIFFLWRCDLLRVEFCRVFYSGAIFVCSGLSILNVTRS